MNKRVMLVDQQVSFRQLLGLVLPQEGNFKVVAEASTGLEALRLQRELKPDLIILDLLLPDFSGVGLLRHLREQQSETRTLVFSSTNHQELIMSALRTRPHGFVLKRDPFDKFREALKAVNSGCSYLAPLVTRLLDKCSPEEPVAALSPREYAVVQMIAEGRSNKEMARQLAISVKTVEHHRAHLMDKLMVRDVAGLTRFAIRKGLVSAE